MTVFASRTTGLLRYFMRAYPARSVLMVGLLGLAGIVEGVGVATLLPLLELAIGGAADASRLSEAVARLLGVAGLPPTLGVLLGLIVFAISAKAVFLWLAMRQVGYTVAQVTTDLRVQLLRALMRARWSYFASQPTGRFANAISYEAHRAASAYREACVIFAGLLQILVYLAVALLVSWQMALATLLIGTAFLFLLRGLVRVARTAGVDQTELLRSLVSRLTDALGGIKPIRAMGRESHLLPLFERETEGLNQAQRRQVAASETLRLFQEPTLALLLALGLFAALTLGNQPFPAVLLLAFVFYRLMTQANTLQSRYQVLAIGESAFWSLKSQIESAEEAREGSSGRRQPPPLVDGIRLHDVRFSYGETPVLSGISLTIAAGAFTALYGPSGAGKTTVADLVLGLHRPASGGIEVDGVPLDEIDLLAWRRGIGYVPQETFLFHDTIHRNVTLGDESLTREDVEGALRAADAWEFVAGREGGLEWMVGQAGSRLSGGERQRIAIARALVHRPRLLLLDESTASLDPATEREILRTLGGLKGRVTILAISHQPAVRDAADVVYCLERGEVTEMVRPPRATTPHSRT